MLDLEHINQQAKKLVLDVSRITARHAARLKHIHNPAKRIYRLEHTGTRVVFSVIGRVPDDIAIELWSAYERHFGC